MSRVAKAPVSIPAGVEVKLNGQLLTIKGKNGELSRSIHHSVEVKHENNELTFSPREGVEGGNAQSGTARALVNSMVIGVTEGFTRKLQLVGVGYRAQIKGNAVALSLGFSHPVEHVLPAGITAECPSQTEIVLKGSDKQLIGQVAADIRAYRRPEPYKGKGVDKKSARIRRAARARHMMREQGVTRLVVHRTPRHIYAQVIAPNGSEVLAAASTVEKAIKEQVKYTGNKDAAAVVGKAVAERALAKGIKGVAFDRSGFKYHGRIQSLADAAREAGLQF